MTASETSSRSSDYGQQHSKTGLRPVPLYMAEMQDCSYLDYVSKPFPIPLKDPRWSNTPTQSKAASYAYSGLVRYCASRSLP
jgi:hypothetical protein